MSAKNPQEGVESVRSFFNSQWRLYRRVLDLNYLFHREVGRTLHRVLEGRKEKFSFLDLACGDAAMTSVALQDTAASRYFGVDISSVALDLARKNIEPLGCSAEFFEGDFKTFLAREPQLFDVMYVGLSVHHLRGIEKRDFLRQARPWIAGSLIIYEPICHPGESRDECLRRWVQCVDATWTELSAEEMTAVKGHVLNCDFPEPVETYRTYAREAGFAGAEVLYQDDDGFYAVMQMTV